MTTPKINHLNLVKKVVLKKQALHMAKLVMAKKPQV